MGIGSGAQDLGQYVISHINPASRRLMENKLLLEYHSALTAPTDDAPVVDNYSFDQCMEDYRHGGVSRWMWMLPLLCTMCPDNMVQFFHDQVAEFIKDHCFTPDNIPMPRV